MRKTIVILLTLGLLAASASAQVWEWQGWYGPDGTTALWGGDWATPGNTYSNGWGSTWVWHEDSTPYFPAGDDSVRIGAGHYVAVNAGVPARCAHLILEPGVLLDMTHGGLHHGGGSIANAGTISGYQSVIELSGDLDFSGPGPVYGSASTFRSWNEPTLTLAADLTLSGQFYIGWVPYGNYEGIHVINHGTLISDDPLTATDLFGLTCVNDGELRVDGGSLRMWGDWDNTGGRMTADAGLFHFAHDDPRAARVHGGTLESTNGGEFRLQGWAALEDLRLDGTLRIPRYGTGTLRGVIENDGEILLGVNGWAGSSYVVMDTTLTLAGVGETRLGASNGFINQNWSASNPLLVIGADQTVLADGGQFGIGPDYYGDRRIRMENRGALIVDPESYHGFFRLAGAGLTNTGLFEVGAAPNRIEFHGAYRQTAGRTVIDGALHLYEGPLVIEGGTLEGDGAVHGSVDLSRTTVHAGRDGAGGELNVHGNLGLENSTIVWEWDPVLGRDRLIVAGTLAATDTVTVRVASAWPDGAKSVDAVVAQYAALADTAVWVLETPDGWDATLVVEPTQLRLTGVTGYPTGADDAPKPVLAALRAEPNPFNPRTTLRFRLDAAGEARLSIFDLTGRRVRRLAAGRREAGDHEVVWAGRDDAGRPLASGAYLAVLETAAGRVAQRLALVK